MQKQRNISIDLLRIVLMLFIIIGHLLTHTHIRIELDFFTTQGLFVWGLQTLILCAVNCFILITGYFSIHTQFHVEHVLKIWLKMFVYALFIGGGMLSLKYVPININNVLNMFFPFLRQVWWFMSSYILLYLFSPFLNIALRKLTYRQYSYLVLLICFMFYVLPLFSAFFPLYDSTKGMGIIGFVTLYIIGAYLSVYQVKLAWKYCLIGLIVNNLFILSSKIGLDFISNTYHLGLGSSLCYNYNTIFELCNAILLFLLSKQMPLRSFHKLITFASSSVLAVYLIHEHPLVRQWLWHTGLQTTLKQSAFWQFAIFVFTIPIGILICCIFIDKLVSLTMIGPVSHSFFWNRLNAKMQFFDKLFTNKEEA